MIKGSITLCIRFWYWNIILKTFIKELYLIQSEKKLWKSIGSLNVTGYFLPLFSSLLKKSSKTSFKPLFNDLINFHQKNRKMKILYVCIDNFLLTFETCISGRFSLWKNQCCRCQLHRYMSILYQFRAEKRHDSWNSWLYHSDDVS